MHLGARRIFSVYSSFFATADVCSYNTVFTFSYYNSEHRIAIPEASYKLSRTMSVSAFSLSAILVETKSSRLVPSLNLWEKE